MFILCYLIIVNITSLNISLTGGYCDDLRFLFNNENTDELTYYVLVSQLGLFGQFLTLLNEENSSSVLH